MIILLGDRYETFATAISAYINRIPILHIHGGEKTFNSLDDNYRHSISKLSNVHLVSHKLYKKRLIQLGENKKYLCSWWIRSKYNKRYQNIKKIDWQNI